MPPHPSTAVPVPTPGAGPSSGSKIKLEPAVMQRLRPSRHFRDAIEMRTPWTSVAHEGYSVRPQISSLAFNDSGDACMTAGEDEAFVRWDAVRGTMQKRFPTRKYGISQICFTHHKYNILHTSTKESHDIRHHATHDNKYLAYMKGHTARVRSIQMHPLEDCFISGSDDGTVRIWDLRQGACLALLNNIGGSAIAAYDPQGMVFAVASSDIGAVMLYATNAPDAAPFHFAQIQDTELDKISQPPRRPVFTSITFSPAGDLILLGTSSDAHYVLDGYDLRIHRRLVGHQGLEADHQGNKDLQPRRGGSSAEVGWTADSRWIFSGSADGTICMWDMSQHPQINVAPNSPAPPVQSLPPSIRLKPDNPSSQSPARAVRFNPRNAMMAVGGESLSFWLPEKEDRVEDGY